MVSIDSSRAASMKAQVLTTTRSASSGRSAADIPSATSVPASLSESTWFLGQPRVSSQYLLVTPPKLPGPPGVSPVGHFLPSIRFILVPHVGQVPWAARRPLASSTSVPSNSRFSRHFTQ